ncbi:MAG: chemotaxis protein CheA [Candidatus Brachytrichaceae bacterium NZ_4S206]
MQQLIAELDRLATTVLGLEPTDLQALADAHTQLERIESLLETAADLPFELTQRFESTAVGAKKSVEKLILNEIDDTDAALRALSTTVCDLQSILDGKPPTDALAPTLPAPESTSAPAAAAPQMPAERVFAEDDLPLLNEFVGESHSHLETAEQELLKLEENPGAVDSISAIFRSFHTIKGVAGFLNLEQIQRLAHAAESLLDRARDGKLALTGEASQLVLESIDQMKTLMNAVSSSAATGKPLVADPAAPTLIARLHDFLEHGQTRTAPTAATTEAAVATGEGTSSAEQAATGTQQQQSDLTIKVSTTRLDKLIDMVGELVIAESMVAQDVSHGARTDQRSARHLSELSKIVRELQDLSMSLRMVPVGTVFKKMTRLVRDTARKAGKEVELVISGQETELDRNVVEALGDPLVHMIRNSVDHGIEPPDVREQSGKPRVGRVDLRAMHKGGSIHIEIQDDGRGLNRERILQKARAAGIVGADETPPDQDIYRLIFHAGLSTAEKVTDISGRGVGMDVVKRNIEALRGRVEITTEPGKGSTFTIRLPLTLAVIDGMIVKVGSQKYIIPITSIEQSLRPTAEQISTVYGRGEMCMVRGSLLPIVRLHRAFNVEPKSQDPTEALVVIVHDNDRRACLMVDELLGQQQVVIKSLGEKIGRLPGVSGGAVLGDGNVSLILDVAGLVEL